MDANELLTTTRGVRRRIDFEKPVPYEVLEQCVELAVQAPLGGEEWVPHFIIVEDAEKKAKIGEMYQSVNLPYIDDIEAKALAGAPAESHEAIKRNHNTFRWHGDRVAEHPAIVIVGVMGRFEKADQIYQASAYGSILPAAWSFMLALRSKGLGTTWTTLHLARAGEVGELLGLPEDFTQAVMMPVGYFKGETFKPAKRPPASSFIHRDSW